MHYGDFGIVAPQRTPSASSSAQCYALPINAKAGALFGTFFKPAGRSPKVEDAVRVILQRRASPSTGAAFASRRDLQTEAVQKARGDDRGRRIDQCGNAKPGHHQAGEIRRAEIYSSTLNPCEADRWFNAARRKAAPASS
ncbi:MAG: hypothetical protein ACLPKW_03205 [Acetobacteraceae bacterium]